MRTDPDALIRHMRPWSDQEVLAVVDRLEAMAAASKVSQLKPETALLAAKALRAWLGRVTNRDDIALAICGLRPKCKEPCLACKGRANVVQRMYAGEKEL